MGTGWTSAAERMAEGSPAPHDMADEEDRDE
jgi:hypothetical protein